MPLKEEVGTNGVETRQESAAFSAEQLGTPEGKLAVLKQIRDLKESDPETYRKAADLIRTHNNEHNTQSALEELLQNVDLDATSESEGTEEQAADSQAVDLIGQRRREPRFVTPEVHTAPKQPAESPGSPEPQAAAQSEPEGEYVTPQAEEAPSTEEVTENTETPVSAEARGVAEVIPEDEEMTLERAQTLLHTLNKALENTNTLFLIQNNGTEYSALIQEKGRAEQLIQQNNTEGLKESFEKLSQHAANMNITFETDPDEVKAKEATPEDNDPDEADERDAVPDESWPNAVPQKEDQPQEAPAVGQGGAVSQFPEKTTEVPSDTTGVEGAVNTQEAERPEVPEGYVDVRDAQDLAVLATAEGVTEGTDVSAEALAERARTLIEEELSEKAA